jgi:hypothetical protein
MRPAASSVFVKPLIMFLVLPFGVFGFGLG